MKHLRVLEDAGLVVTSAAGAKSSTTGRPHSTVHDRWVSKYAEPWAAAGDLKSGLEQTMEKVFEIYIKTTPELWAAITDPRNAPSTLRRVDRERLEGGGRATR